MCAVLSNEKLTREHMRWSSLKRKERSEGPRGRWESTVSNWRGWGRREATSSGSPVSEGTPPPLPSTRYSQAGVKCRILCRVGGAREDEGVSARTRPRRPLSFRLQSHFPKSKTRRPPNASPSPNPAKGLPSAPCL